MSESVSFEPFIYVTGLKRFGAAIALNNARNTVSHELAKELPYADKIYQSPLKTYRRIGYVASQMQMGHGNAYVVRFKDKVQGVAARIPAAWTSDTSATNPTELSYWIRRQENPETAVEIGKQIVSMLMFDYKDTNDTHWMVTLPDDEVKRAVCESSGLQPVGQPKQYHINDGVNVDRQLWIK